MEFGRLPQNQLKKVDFSLPKEPSFNKSILPGKKFPHPRIFVGCAKWGRTEWIGKIYPEGTKEKDFLSHYTQHFNAIELNATGYKMPSSEQVEKWTKEATGKDFLFCPKLTRYILPNADTEKEKRYTEQFFDSMHHFGKHLGAVFMTLKSFSPAKAKLLSQFIFDFPKDPAFFIEVRHEAWFNDPVIFDELIKELSLSNTGLIITDTAGRRDVAHMHLTIPKAFIRFVGNSLHKTDFERCDAWVQRIKYWLKNGLQELYFFMHMHDEAKSPELVSYFIQRLNKECKLHLNDPMVSAALGTP